MSRRGRGGGRSSVLFGIPLNGGERQLFRECTGRETPSKGGHSEAWLVIDPKPLVGERELEASGLLRNTDSPSRWLDVLSDLGFDRERARGWGVAHNLAWAWDQHEGWLEEHVAEARRILSAR